MRSVVRQNAVFSDLFVGVDEDGFARDRIIVADRDNEYSSVSGEIRLRRAVLDGTRNHIFVASVRGRELQRRYGGEEVISMGPAHISAQTPKPLPDLTFGPESIDKVRQLTLGVSYQGLWPRVGELNLGMQKSAYSKVVRSEAATLPSGKSQPWLPSLAAAAYVSPWVVLFGGYTEGLEEGPVAPEAAVNRNEAPLAIETRQVDGGVRWQISPELKLIAGGFEITKPYYNLDETSRYRALGKVRHRGAELSLSGTPVRWITMVSGALLLDAKVSGDEVRAGRIGKRPVGAVRKSGFISLDVRPPPLTGWSFDVTYERFGSRTADVANQLKLPARGLLALGARHRFEFEDTRAMIRVQMSNVFNVYGFGVVGSRVFYPNEPRRLQMSLTVSR